AWGSLLLVQSPVYRLRMEGDKGLLGRSGEGRTTEAPALIPNEFDSFGNKRERRIPIKAEREPIPAHVPSDRTESSALRRTPRGMALCFSIGPASLPRTDFIALQRALIPQIQSAVGDDRVRPGVEFTAIGRGKAAVFAIGLGCRFDQCDLLFESAG